MIISRCEFKQLQLKTLTSCLIILYCMQFSSFAFAEQIPMWKGIQKNSTQLEADKIFIMKIKKAGNCSVKQGAYRAIQLGWQFVSKRQPDMAIKRYNQAWLLSPNNPDIHWGYAISTHLQGKPTSIVESHFRKAEQLKNNDPSLFADRGRILEERGLLQKAIKYFRKSLAINPKHRDAHVGMWKASTKLGDTKTAAKHKKRIK